MYIQSVGDCPQTPSCKALYFTKTPTIGLKNTLDYMVHEDVTTTARGIQYLKDTEIPKDIKKRFAENKYVKRMARKFDTFIWFVTSQNKGKYRAWAKIMRVKDGNTELSKNYVIGTSQYDGQSAVSDMFEAMKNERFSV